MPSSSASIPCARTSSACCSRPRRGARASCCAVSCRSRSCSSRDPHANYRKWVTTASGWSPYSRSSKETPHAIHPKSRKTSTCRRLPLHSSLRPSDFCLGGAHRDAIPVGSDRRRFVLVGGRSAHRSRWTDRVYSGFDTSGSLWSSLYFDITGGTITSGPIATPFDVVSFDTRYGPDGGSGVSSVTVGGNLVQWNLSDTFSFVNTSTSAVVTTGVRLKTTFFMADGTTAISGLDLINSTMGDGLPTTVLAISVADLIAWGGGFQVKQEYQTSGGTGPWHVIQCEQRRWRQPEHQHECGDLVRPAGRRA